MPEHLLRRWPSSCRAGSRRCTYRRSASRSTAWASFATRPADLNVHTLNFPELTARDKRHISPCWPESAATKPSKRSKWFATNNTDSCSSDDLPLPASIFARWMRPAACARLLPHHRRNHRLVATDDATRAHILAAVAHAEWHTPKPAPCRAGARQPHGKRTKTHISASASAWPTPTPATAWAAAGRRWAPQIVAEAVRAQANQPNPPKATRTPRNERTLPAFAARP
jgi:hypothetical protein